jgi:ABC-2 type transport system permease protein
MSAVAESTLQTNRASVREVRPSFPGAVRGEFLKLSRQRATLAMLAGAIVLFAVITAAMYSNDNVRQMLDRSPTTFFFNELTIMGTIFNAGSGILLLLVSARLVGMEYTSGTIRVLLARGTGRVQLLMAKWVALAVLGLLLLAGFLVLASGSLYIVVTAWKGSFAPITSLPGVAWHDFGLTLLVALISIGVCILLGTTAAIVGRALAFGIGAAMAFFPADNFGTIVMMLLSNVTHQTFWLKVPGYLLGPNLNGLAGLLETDHHVSIAFATPLEKVDATHAWIVIAVYVAAFLILSIGLTWRRDVLE